MTSSQWQSQAVPAHLSYLAIYNPSLGPSDETFADQLVFYYSRKSHEARVSAKKNARIDHAGGDAIKQEEHEKLRYIGLAQGMVDFARTFSDGRPVDAIDTEKSRIVLQELEKGWWVLASVDLTRLPGTVTTVTDPKKKNSVPTSESAPVEYSSREVSPSRLLVQQLLQAHYVFTLHHGPSLTELFVRLSRDKFCSALERYWARFCRTWDVLLHGNPASDVFSGVKLASGGELGIGVGEEEWGSGEREVLEDLTQRSEGLVDLIVARFGDPASPEEESQAEHDEALPWMGSGRVPSASDGLIFTGINRISRPSLRNLSLWMRQIYTYGEHAYGVRDNPLRERRKRRRREVPFPEPEDISRDPTPPKASPHVSVRDWSRRSKLDSRTISESSVTSKSANSKSSSSTKHDDLVYAIPPPIVTATEQALDKATQQAETTAASRASAASDAESSTTLGIPDQYMKYLTLGLSTLAKPRTSRRPKLPRRSSSSSSQTLTNPSRPRGDSRSDSKSADRMTNVDPIPEGEALNLRIKSQRHRESRGHFVIGLKGDLDALASDAEAEPTDGSIFDGSEGNRTLLRTVQIEITHDPLKNDVQTPASEKSDTEFLMVAGSSRTHRRLRVLIYVHRPFMYCFLFENRTPSLSIASFYKSLHRNLTPIHKPLLNSTSQARTLQRIEDAQVSAPTSNQTSVVSSEKPNRKGDTLSHIYDLIFDPALLTVHTSIPNIPEPGTPAAEGLITAKRELTYPPPPPWTRLDALNVHSQILNTLDSVSHNQNEHECTSKTSRGWWIVWMQLPPSAPPPPPTNLDTTASSKPSHIQPPSSAQQHPSSSRRTSEHPVPQLHTTESDETDATAVTSGTGAFGTLPSIASSRNNDIPPEQRPRIAFLVRQTSDIAFGGGGNARAASMPGGGTGSNNVGTGGASFPGGRAVSSMWNTLSLRPTAAETAATDDAAAAAGATSWGPAALAGGIGIDARKYVEGLLSLNR